MTVLAYAWPGKPILESEMGCNYDDENFDSRSLQREVDKGRLRVVLKLHANYGEMKHPAAGKLQDGRQIVNNWSRAQRFCKRCV